LLLQNLRFEVDEKLGRTVAKQMKLHFEQFLQETRIFVFITNGIPSLLEELTNIGEISVLS